MIILESKRLRVEIPLPGEAPNISYRFDRAGFIAEVVLDGIIRYCATEPQNLRHPSSGGRGLCNEYRFPICEDTPIGEYFPKFGIGLYRKQTEGKYIFYEKYKEVQPFEILVAHVNRSATFTTLPKLCQGYSLQTVKKVMVESNTLTMEILATNTGNKPLCFEEFCHNFLSIDGMAIGSDYVLEMPQIQNLGTERLNNRSGSRPGSMRGMGNGITFCEYSAIDTDFAIDPETLTGEDTFYWHMSHKGAKASVSCIEGYKPSKIAIWAVDHMLCPEVVHTVSLEVGQSHVWRRTWTFDHQHHTS